MIVRLNVPRLEASEPRQRFPGRAYARELAASGMLGDSLADRALSRRRRLVQHGSLALSLDALDAG